MPRLPAAQRPALAPGGGGLRCCLCAANPKVASPASADSLASNEACGLPTLLSISRSNGASEKTLAAACLDEAVVRGVPTGSSLEKASSPTATSTGAAVSLSTEPESPAGLATEGSATPTWTKPSPLSKIFARKGSRRCTSGSQPSNEPLKTAGSEELFTLAPENVPAIGGCVELQQPHSEFLLPPEVVLFEPSKDEVFSGGVPAGGNRQIFLNTPLLAEENQSLLELHRGLQARGHPAGEFPNFMKLHALRMLQQCKYDAERTIALMQTCLAERVARLPISEADVINDLHSGFMYWHGRDRKCRPCLVIRLERMGDMVRDKERAVRLVIYCLEYAVRFALVPGRVENWNVILDFENVLSIISPLHLVSMTSTAVGIAVALEKVYCSRMVWMKIVNMPGHGVLRNLVNGAIPANKKKKVSFPTDLAAAMAEDFEPSQLEKRYGGTSQDLEPGETYPFRFFPSCTGQERSPPEHQSLHAFSNRAFHEGHVWDDSLPETQARWLQQARITSLAPFAAQTASRMLETQGGLDSVRPCCDVPHWLELASLAELSRNSKDRFAVAGATRAASGRPVARRRWW